MHSFELYIHAFIRTLPACLHVSLVFLQINVRQYDNGNYACPYHFIEVKPNDVCNSFNFSTTLFYISV